MSKNGIQSNAERKDNRKISLPKPSKEVIAISFRLEGKHLGKAAFYDHFTLQGHTGFETAVLCSKTPRIQSKYLGDYVSTQTVNLPHSPMNTKHGRPTPVELESHLDGGLLYIPGMTRDSYEKKPEVHQERVKFEQEILRDALKRGRPILAVCAGTWTLWETLGGSVKAVSDHNYGGGMPRISAKGKMTFNKHVHDVIITPNTLLHNMMELGDQVEERTLPANSIHWKAPDGAKIPNNFEVSAVSKKNSDVSIQTRQQTEMSPDENTIEGFSSIFGAPVAGFVWHLEAFDWSSRHSADVANNKALLFMAKAGSAYRAKQNMLSDFKSQVKAVNEDDINTLSTVFSKMKV